MIAIALGIAVLLITVGLARIWQPYINMIIKPFNYTWWCILLVFLAIFVIEAIIAGRKGPLIGKSIFKANAVVLLIVFVVYKICILHDGSYNAVLIANNLPATAIWTELPLHLCDIGIILLVIGAFTENRMVLGHCLLINFPAAIVACIMPLCGFSGYSIFLPRVAGYYFTHWMIAFCSISIIGFKLYCPRKKEVKKILAFAVSIFAAIFVFTLAVRFFGLNENVNFYYSIEPIENAVLKYCWSLIPIPGLYLLPIFILLCVYCYLAVFLMERLRKCYFSRKASRT